MRKHQQKQILELIGTLNEAHGETKRLLSRGETIVSVKLLADCQDCIIQLSEFIEKIAGEGTQTVLLLEKYNECLYFTSVEINQSGANSSIVKRLLKQLKKHLIAIEKSVSSEFKPKKIEVVFLPYKAAMFDSLESIWQAAEKDSCCDAYVIPIPYYERLSDGQFGKMHYERDLYPSNIPTMDWQDYNLENRRPDIIFIHYPYDDNNYATSIHPSYYSKRLKEFTDLLVYVPYFVGGDYVQKHFCVCAGTIYADKVIVQSEKIRQIYIGAFKEFETENNCKGKFGKSEDKFIALGSPKFDAVINVNLEDFILPEAWQNLINSPDGTKKKVIFYNTTISNILHESKQYVKKIRHVLNVFSQRSDVVLWWRPHPLTGETYKAMRPQLLNEYEQIVTNYKQEKRGIYDDTPDLYRAIALCDAYYGDGGSIISMFGMTGKPIMLQDAKLYPNNTSKNPLYFTHFYDDNEFLWFSALNLNGMFRMKRQTLEIEYILNFCDETNTQELYNSIASYEDKLYFIPLTAQYMFIYDAKEKTSRKIPFSGGKRPLSTYKFSYAVNYKNFIFLIPCEKNAIIRFNAETEEMEFYWDWQDKLTKIQEHSNIVTFGSKCVVGEDVILPAVNAPAVVVFNMRECVSDVIKIGKRNTGYNGICFDGENYWLAPRFTDSIVKWNRESGQYKEYNNLSGDYSKFDVGYVSVEYLNGYVWCLPYFASHAIKINVATDEITIADEFQIECDKENASSDYLYNVNYIFSKVIGDTIYALTGKSNTLISYNAITGERQEEKILLNDEQFKKIMTDRKRVFYKRAENCETMQNCMISECFMTDLYSYLDYVVEGNDSLEAKAMNDKQIDIFKKTSINTDGSAGQAIWEYAKTICAKKERL